MIINGVKFNTKIKTNNKLADTSSAHISVIEQDAVKPSVSNFQAYSIPFTSQTKDSDYYVERIVKKSDKNEYQGKALFMKYPDGKLSDYISWEDKIGWDKLKNEPIDWKTASSNDIQVFYHALALAETNDTTWVSRFNPMNRKSPLAVRRSIYSDIPKAAFNRNLDTLNKLQLESLKIRSLLDTPIFDEKGDLNFQFTVFDTETTGINVPDEPSEIDMAFSHIKNDDNGNKPSKIVQIGAIKFDKGGNVIPDSALNQLINPEEEIPQEASDVHGIYNKDLKDKPTMASVLRRFSQKYLKDDIIVAYNAKFDIPLLNHSIREYNDFQTTTKLKKRELALVVDPMILQMRIHPYLGAKKTLSNQYKFLFGQDLEGAHDAFADVRATADVLKYTLNYLQKTAKDPKKPLTLREVLYFQNGIVPEKSNIGIKLDCRGLNSAVKFDRSYRPLMVGVDNFPKGFSITSTKGDVRGVVDNLLPQIGSANVQKIITEGLLDETFDDFYDGHEQLPKETLNRLKSKYKGKLVNRQYLMEENFRIVLNNIGLTPYEDKSIEDIKDIIVKKSKFYINKKFIDLWVKNPKISNASKGNDLPDFDLSKKVMLERYKEDERCKEIKQRELKDIVAG